MSRPTVVKPRRDLDRLRHAGRCGATHPRRRRLRLARLSALSGTERRQFPHLALSRPGRSAVHDGAVRCMVRAGTPLIVSAIYDI